MFWLNRGWCLFSGGVYFRDNTVVQVKPKPEHKRDTLASVARAIHKYKVYEKISETERDEYEARC